MAAWSSLGPLSKVAVVSVPVAALAMLGVAKLGGAMVKDSGAYRHALSFCATEPSLVREIGTPMDDGPFPTGHIGDDRATLSFSLHGAAGAGTVDIVESRTSREWRVTYASWTSSNGGRRNLDPEK